MSRGENPSRVRVSSYTGGSSVSFPGVPNPGWVVEKTKGTSRDVKRTHPHPGTSSGLTLSSQVVQRVDVPKSLGRSRGSVHPPTGKGCPSVNRLGRHFGREIGPTRFAPVRGRRTSTWSSQCKGPLRVFTS